MRRAALALILGVSGAYLGGWLGGSVYLWRAPSWAQGGDLDQLSSIVAGAFVGGLAGVLIGSVALGSSLVPWRVAALAAIGCIAAAGMFGTAVWQVGAFTDADGPSGIRPYLLVALGPVSVAVVWLLMRWTGQASGDRSRNEA